MFSQHSFQVKACYWGLNADLVEDSVELLAIQPYEDAEWAVEYREWCWYVESITEAEELYAELRKNIPQLTVDILRYDIELSTVH